MGGGITMSPVSGIPTTIIEMSGGARSRLGIIKKNYAATVARAASSRRRWTAHEPHHAVARFERPRTPISSSKRY
jgi:hypothetical protein